MADSNNEEMPSQEEIAKASETLRKIGLTPIALKSPRMFVHSLEINGNLAIVSGDIKAFSKIVETTWVFKRIT